MKNSTWSGRFKKGLDEDVLEFSESVSVDHLLFDCDIKVCIAHAEMLGECKIITKRESITLIKGLKAVQKKYDSGKLSLSIKYEDVHMNIEQALTKEVGDLGKKIHMGRSRNDLVATDFRLYLRESSTLIIDKLRDIRYALAVASYNNSETIFPGYTHLQLAQPVTFGHHLLAWHDMLARDEQRMEQTKDRLNILPLGSAALSGTPYNINRKTVAKKLGFKSVSTNSMDSVSDRDFVCDFAYTCSMVMMHLSRMSEELVFWMNTHIKLVDIDEAFCTGSSIMPQKKNPDVPELIRGKSAAVIGSLSSLFVLLKGLPLTYNRDLQEDKTIMLEALESVTSCLNLMPRLISTMKVNKDRALAFSKQDFSNATDLADYLSMKGVPFRTSHEIVGNIVKYAESKKISLNEIPLGIFKKFSSSITKDVYDAIDIEKSIHSKKALGSTSPSNVKKQAKKILVSLKPYGYVQI
jgi:argininosuccinate lyase